MLALSTSASSAESARANSSTRSNSSPPTVASRAARSVTSKNNRRCGMAATSCSSRWPEKARSVSGNKASSSPKPTGWMLLASRHRAAADPAVAGTSATRVPRPAPRINSCSLNATSSGAAMCSTSRSSPPSPRAASCAARKPPPQRKRKRSPPLATRAPGSRASGRSGAWVKYCAWVRSSGHSVTSIAVRNSQRVFWPRGSSDCTVVPRGTRWPRARFGSAVSADIRITAIDGTGARKLGYSDDSSCAMSLGCSASSFSCTRAARKAKPSSRRST